MSRFGCGIAPLLLALSAFGCGETVGECDDPLNGRDTVRVSDTVMYAGQAIMNKACASGCHSSSAQGPERNGAPSGLDFDVVPIAEDKASGESKNKRDETIVKLKSSQVEGLRDRQKKIVQERDFIWQQIRLGLMPPRGRYEGFLKLVGIKRTPEDEPCNAGKNISDLDYDTSQEALRKWLACGAPLVETNGANVEKNAEVRGTAGWQYQLCSASGDGEPVTITLQSLMDGPFSGCGSCHPGLAASDLSTLDKAREHLLDSKDAVCEGKPFVTRGDPDQSFLYDLVSKDDPGCMQSRMPYANPPLTDSELAQVKTWIEKGAPATEADAAGDEPSGDDEPSSTGDDDDSEEPSGDDDEGSEPEEPLDAGKDAGRVGDAGRDAGGSDAGRDAGRSDAGRSDAGRDAGR